jgi:hypothetical protein
MKVREHRIILNAPAVLANVKLDVVALAFGGFLVDVFAAGVAFDVAFEAWVRKCFVACVA